MTVFAGGGSCYCTREDCYVWSTKRLVSVVGNSEQVVRPHNSALKMKLFLKHDSQ